MRAFEETSAHVVSRATDLRTGRPVVLKSARAGTTTIAREAEALSALAGTGVVRCYEVVAGPLPTLVLERLRGPTLEARLHLGALSEDEIATLGRALFEVLARLWSLGWVHGDVKPSNVVLARGDVGRPVLVDFECATRIGEPFPARLTAAYAAPERIIAAREARASSDVFSLGATLYACARGASPFEGPTRDASLVRVLTHEPPLLEELSPELAAHLARMLHKTPAKRPTELPARWTKIARPAGSLRALARRASSRGRPPFVLGATNEPYGSFARALASWIGATALPSFAALVAALRRKLPGRSSLEHARHLAILVRPDPDEATVRALEPARLDASLLRRKREAAARAVLRALSRERAVLVIERGVDATSLRLVEPSLPSFAVVEERAPSGSQGATSPRPRGDLPSALVAGPFDDAEETAHRFSDAGEPLSAAYHAWRGAERALEAADLDRSRMLAQLAETALFASRGPVTTLLGALVGVTKARLGRWTGDLEGALSAARAALAALPSNSASYCDALAERALVAGKRSDVAELLTVARALREPPGEGAELAWDRAASRTATQLYYLGAGEAADVLVALFLDRTTLASGAPDTTRRGLSPAALVTAALFHGRLDEYLARLEAAFAAFRALDDVRSECLYGSAIGFAHTQLGCYRTSVSFLERVRARAVRSGIGALVAAADHNLGEALSHVPGRLVEAIDVEGRAVEALRREGDRRLLGGSLAYRSRMFAAAGELDRAERDAREAVDIGRDVPPLAPLSFGSLAFVEIARGRPEAALAAAERAHAALSTRTPLEAGEAYAHLALAEALRAAGRRRDARRSARRGLAEIDRKASLLRDRKLRASFLERVPEHRALRRLSEASR